MERTSAGHLVQTLAKAGLTLKLDQVAEGLVQSRSQCRVGYNQNFLSCNLSVASRPFTVHFKVDDKSSLFRYFVCYVTFLFLGL